MYQQTPDVLLIPSDLMLFAKVSNFTVINGEMFRISITVFVSIQVCWLRAKLQAAMLTSRLISSSKSMIKWDNHRVTKQQKESELISLIFD
jgi:hypothetical protein